MFPEDLAAWVLSPPNRAGPGEAPDGRLPYKIEGFGAGSGPVPGGGRKFSCIGSGPKPYKFIGFGDP